MGKEQSFFDQHFGWLEALKVYCDVKFDWNGFALVSRWCESIFLHGLDAVFVEFKRCRA